MTSRPADADNSGMGTLFTRVNAQAMEANGGPLVTQVYPVMAGLLLLTGILGAGLTSTAHAQDTPAVPKGVSSRDKATPDSMPQGNQSPLAMNAWQKAMALMDYSANNNGVGVFVNFAAAPEIDPERLLRSIEVNFARRGIPINLQTNISKGSMTTVTFFLKATPFAGPSGNGYTLGQVPAGFDYIAEAYKEQQPGYKSRR